MSMVVVGPEVDVLVLELLEVLVLLEVLELVELLVLELELELVLELIQSPSSFNVAFSLHWKHTSPLRLQIRHPSSHYKVNTVNDARVSSHRRWQEIPRKDHLFQIIRHLHIDEVPKRRKITLRSLNNNSPRLTYSTNTSGFTIINR